MGAWNTGLFAEAIVGWCRTHVGNAPLLNVGKPPADGTMTKGWWLAGAPPTSRCASSLCRALSRMRADVSTLSVVGANNNTRQPIPMRTDLTIHYLWRGRGAQDKAHQVRRAVREHMGGWTEAAKHRPSPVNKP